MAGMNEPANVLRPAQKVQVKGTSIAYFQRYVLSSQYSRIPCVKQKKEKK